MLHILPLLSTACIAISAVFVAFGWVQIRKGNKEAHKKIMLTGAGFALAFFLIYVSKSIFEGNTLFAGPDDLKPYYFTFLIFHIVLATVAAVFGVTTLYLAFKERFMKHKRVGRITATIWFLTAITGITVYILLYVMYPGGETKGLIDAIKG